MSQAKIEFAAWHTGCAIKILRTDGYDSRITIEASMHDDEAVAMVYEQSATPLRYHVDKARLLDELRRFCDRLDPPPAPTP